MLYQCFSIIFLFILYLQLIEYQLQVLKYKSNFLVLQHKRYKVQIEYNLKLGFKIIVLLYTFSFKYQYLLNLQAALYNYNQFIIIAPLSYQLFIQVKVRECSFKLKSKTSLLKLIISQLVLKAIYLVLQSIEFRQLL